VTECARNTHQERSSAILADMGQSSSERAWASRARRKKVLSPEERERLSAYERHQGRAGRKPWYAKKAPTPEAAAAPAAPRAEQSPPEPPASSAPPPSSGAGGEGGPPIDLGAAPANDQASPGVEDAAAAAAAKAAAERKAIIEFGAAYIGQLLRSCDPIIRAADLPLPPLPEFVVGVTVKCWEITLDKWLPAEVGDPREHAELVACTTTGYQLAVSWWARKRLVVKEQDKKVNEAAAAPASSAPTPPAPPPVTARARNLWGAGADPAEKSA
jgi:hypothetical protein